jgi:hypothetical protein
MKYLEFIGFPQFPASIHNEDSMADDIVDEDQIRGGVEDDNIQVVSPESPAQGDVEIDPHHLTVSAMTVEIDSQVDVAHRASGTGCRRSEKVGEENFVSIRHDGLFELFKIRQTNHLHRPLPVGLVLEIFLPMQICPLLILITPFPINSHEVLHRGNDFLAADKVESSPRCSILLSYNPIFSVKREE